jgi:beta-glucosidase
MTLREKIGQMTQPDRGHLKGVEDVASYALGSVLSGGGSAPKDDSLSGWRKMISEYEDAARRTRLGIPLIYGIDAVHGHNNVKGAVIYPHQIGLGATRDAELVERVARATAEEVAATGIDWNFSPVLAASRDERWGRTYEAFGEVPELAVELGPAAIRGYQGPRLGQAQPSVLACAKHFAGDGGTQGGKDRGDTIDPLPRFRELHVNQYEPAIRAGVGSVMVSYSSYQGIRMHARRDLVTDVLKGELGFRGFVVSDYEAVEQLPGSYEEQVAAALYAGVDMVMGAKSFVRFIDTLEKLVPARVPETRLDDAVTRILTVKCELGLFKPAAAPDAELLAKFGGAEHREVAREAVRKSLVLLKNENGVLPLKTGQKRLHVAGKNADNLGNQCGGWTITWQGKSGAITTGTTILQGLREIAGPTTQVTHSLDGSGAAGADASIVVVGETPYAEYEGDRTNLALAPEDVSVIRNVKATKTPLVVVLVTGRPLILGSVLDDADAVVVAWLPGSEGGGVADVLFGRHAPTGKLPVSWPRNMADIPLNKGDSGAEPLFPFGHGLTFSTP